MSLVLEVLRCADWILCPLVVLQVTIWPLQTVCVILELQALITAVRVRNVHESTCNYNYVLSLPDSIELTCPVGSSYLPGCSAKFSVCAPNSMICNSFVECSGAIDEDLSRCLNSK